MLTDHLKSATQLHRVLVFCSWYGLDKSLVCIPYRYAHLYENRAFRISYFEEDGDSELDIYCQRVAEHANISNEGISLGKNYGMKITNNILNNKDPDWHKLVIWIKHHANR